MRFCFCREFEALRRWKGRLYTCWLLRRPCVHAAASACCVGGAVLGAVRPECGGADGARRASARSRRGERAAYRR
eukprot:484914-Pleurochrysis_carterae.AAC.1